MGCGRGFSGRGAVCIYYRARPAAGLEKIDMGMAADTIGFMAVGMAVLAFLWTLHREIGALRQEMHRDIGEMRRDIGGLREGMSDLRGRVSRVEGMLAGAGLKVSPESASG